MKINQGKISYEQGPFNEIYHAYEAVFLNLLEQRRVFHSPGDNSYYVPMPQIETRLKNFVQSGTAEIGLLVGPIGIGKSSIFRHLVSTNWGSKQNIETIFLDLNKRKTAFQALNLPENFSRLDRADQKTLIGKAVDLYVASEIEGHISDLFKVNQSDESFHMEFYEFFLENNPELLMPHAFFQPSATEDKINILRQVQKENRLGFLYVSLKFFAVIKKLNNFIIVVDNCDQKDPIIIESFIDTLCQLDSCFESIRGSYDFTPRLISFIACRPSTRWILEDEAPNGALGTHGYDVIVIDTPCSLPSLIKRRIDNMKEIPSYGEVKIVSSNGITWEVSRHQRFLEKLCESLEANGHGAALLSLCNRNMADVLRALTEILSNNRFVDLDRIIGDIVPDDEQPEIGFPRLAILRALAYGNPANDPIYPTNRTRIPNLLSGQLAIFPKTFIKPRLLQLLLLGKSRQRIHWQMNELIAICKEFFEKNEADTISILCELYSEGLIDTEQGCAPSHQKSESGIISTSRAEYLWEELDLTDSLLGFYRDDLHLADGHQWTRVPTFQLGLPERCSEMLTLSHNCVEGELREIGQIAGRASIAKFFSIFGETYISDKILSGVGVSVYTFYKRYQRNDKNAEIESRFRAIAEMLEAGKKTKHNQYQI